MMLTIALTYYNAPDMLAKHLQVAQGYPDGVRLVVVDDGSQEAPAAMSGCPVPYELWRIIEDWPWNQDAARNLAMSRASGRTLVTDMDHLLTPDQAHQALRVRLPVGRALRPARMWPDGAPRGKRHPNSYLMHAEDYWRTGGMDERLSGYYGTDGKLRRQLQRADVTITDTDAFVLTLYEGIIDDATAALGRKGSRHDARQHPELKRRLNDSGATAAADRLLSRCEYVDGSD